MGEKQPKRIGSFGIYEREQHSNVLKAVEREVRNRENTNQEDIDNARKIISPENNIEITDGLSVMQKQVGEFELASPLQKFPSHKLKPNTYSVESESSIIIFINEERRVFLSPSVERTLDALQILRYIATSSFHLRFNENTVPLDYEKRALFNKLKLQKAK